MERGIMFKFFLKKKILSFAKKKTSGEKEKASTPAPKRNRRIIERYNIDYKHLTILSDQNILIIKDISPKGFATGLAKQSYDKFLIDDVYDGRIRYLGEAYDVRARVTWKHKELMGFELLRPTRQTVGFLSRLIRPVEIAASLKEVDSQFMQFENENKAWFHGENETDLYMWYTPTGELIAWQLCLGDEFVEWQITGGIKTGKLNQSVLDFGTPLSSDNAVAKRDQIIALEKLQLAQDIIMASNVNNKHVLLETLRGS